jgi:hypothetical protein
MERSPTSLDVWGILLGELSTRVSQPITALLLGTSCDHVSKYCCTQLSAFKTDIVDKGFETVYQVNSVNHLGRQQRMSFWIHFLYVKVGWGVAALVADRSWVEAALQCRTFLQCERERERERGRGCALLTVPNVHNASLFFKPR